MTVKLNQLRHIDGCHGVIELCVSLSSSPLVLSSTGLFGSVQPKFVLWFVSIVSF